MPPPYLSPRSLLRATTTSPSFADLSKPVYAPYYVYFGNPSTPKMADAFDSLGMKAVTVGFASAPKGEYKLTTDLDILQPDAVNFVNKGGDVSLSFGGNLQDQTVPRQHVQQACTDAPSLAKLIQDSMAKFQTNNVEFDIETMSQMPQTAITGGAQQVADVFGISTADATQKMGDTTMQSLNSSSSPDQTNRSEFFTAFQNALGGVAPLAAASALKSVAEIQEAGHASTILQPAKKAALPEPAAAVLSACKVPSSTLHVGAYRGPRENAATAAQVELAQPVAEYFFIRFGGLSGAIEHCILDDSPENTSEPDIVSKMSEWDC
ncbi:hypothetical protein B0H14DRAFT_2582507 [Mycena olivaceomarginata]|nr:hypothetical protein B0H14DRAFT_2582507 [Mycena olivaceomarginata]